MHAEGFQPLLQLAEGRPEREGGTCGSSAMSPSSIAVPPPPPAPVFPPDGDPNHSPLLGVQVAAADGNGEEAGGAGGGAVAVQEAPDVEAEVSGAGQVVGVSAHPADDLGDSGREEWAQPQRGHQNPLRTPTPRGDLNPKEDPNPNGETSTRDLNSNGETSTGDLNLNEDPKPKARPQP